MPAPPHYPEALRARYAPTRTLGAGAFGVVHEAVDRELDRAVAVKVLTCDFDPASRERFRREARVLARLEHPSVVRVFDSDADASPPYLVMELLEGAAASEAPIDDVEAVMADVARGLAALHAEGLVHRDVKPANVFVTREGRGVLLDLGLVLALEGSTRHTRTGALVGTPLYLAPELFEGGQGTPASDWFSWGATFYELVEGRPLRDGLTLDQLTARGFATAPTFSTLPTHDPRARLVRRCVDADPTRRPAGLDEILRALEGPAEAAAPPPAPREVSPADPTLAVRAEGLRDPGGAAPPSRRRARGFPWSLAGLALLVVGGALVPWPSRSPSPDLVPQAPAPREDGGRASGEASPSSGSAAPRAGSPVPGVDVADLEEELGRALRARWGADGAAAPDGEGLPLHDALLRFGLVLLDELPQQRLLIDWLDRGGLPEDLPAGFRESLRRQDRELRDLSLPPLYAPWLPPLPADRPAPLPAALEDLPSGLREDLATVAPPAGAPETPLQRLRASTRDAALEALELRRAVEEAYRRGDPELRAATDVGQGFTLLTGGIPGELPVLVGTLRATPEGRAVLRERLSRVEVRARRFFVLASRLLGSPDLPDPDAVLEATRSLEFEVSAGLMPTCLTASRARLFGPVGRTHQARAFQARLLERLAPLRERSFLALPPVGTSLAEAWGAARGAAVEVGDHAAAARYWISELEALERAEDAVRFSEVYAAHSEQLRTWAPVESQRWLDDASLLMAMQVMRGKR